MLVLISKRCIILITICALVFLQLVMYVGFNPHIFNHGKSNLYSYSIWKGFDIPLIKTDCFSTSEKDYNLEKLVSDIKSLKKSTSKNGCEDYLDEFDNIFKVSHQYSRALSFPKKFQERLRKSLNENLFNSLSHQLLIYVFNHVTLESSVYNPLRSKRPVVHNDENIWSYVEKLSSETHPNCDFCKYKDFTAVDELGRHETQFTVRVTNTFKLEKWHGMIIMKKHHPTNFSLQEFEMFLNDVVNWANEVQVVDPSYIYPSAVWDVLYKAGASQIHPHIHVLVSRNYYFGKVEQLRRAAQNYFEKTGHNYFTKLVEIYSALGLAVRLGKAVALCTLAGSGDLEVMILSDTPNSDLFRLFYFTLQVYHELNFPCHSMFMGWSALGSSERAKFGKVPAILRVMTRGNCMSKTNDISSIDLFLTNFRDYDPWFLSRHLHKKISNSEDLYKNKKQK
ncbi:UNVERIFIED_CONTAM: hypothetical protein RMT77_016438 [Armadillidium vulgare]